jgi:hypothetical protein
LSTAGLKMNAGGVGGLGERAFCFSPYQPNNVLAKPHAEAVLKALQILNLGRRPELCA